MVTSWDISDDGLTYTFTVRDDVPWVRFNGDSVEQVYDCNGNPRYVTAHDFAYAIRRTANPATNADYAYVLNMFIEGADEFNQGETNVSGDIGIKAIDDITLEIKMKQAAVYDISILSLWFTHAMPEWVINGDNCNEGHGGKWIEPGFFQSYGPYTMKDWIHDTSFTLIKNPFWPGGDIVPVPQIDEIVWKLTDVGPAFAEFEAGFLDVAELPAMDYVRIHADEDLSTWINKDYSLDTEFYAFNTTLAPTNDARVRLALSKAIDREKLLADLMKTDLPAPYFSHPGLIAAPKPEDFSALGVFYDPTNANFLLQQYLDEKNKTASELQISLMYNTSETHRQVAEAIQQMWQDVLGIEVRLLDQEWIDFKQTRLEGKENIYRSNWMGEYPDTNNFLMDVFGLDGAYQEIVNWHPYIAEPEEAETEDSEPSAFDKFIELCETAAQTQDQTERTSLYAQAEEVLVIDQAVVIPLFWYSKEILIRPEVIYPVSNTGIYHFEKWDIIQ